MLRNTEISIITLRRISLHDKETDRGLLQNDNLIHTRINYYKTFMIPIKLIIKVLFIHVGLWVCVYVHEYMAVYV